MRVFRIAPATVAVFGLLVVLAGVLFAAGQPLITDDAWLHWSLGRAYASSGPWLAGDPLLANALGPPTPAAWLFDVVLYGLERVAGFTGLRALHVALVAIALGLVWAALRRAGASVVAGAVGLSVFVVLAAYRLIQLRPHLLSIIAALVLYRLVVDRARAPSRAGCAAAVVLLAVWANVHAAFLLGPLIVATAFGALVVSLPLQSREQSRPEEKQATRARLLALGVTGVLGLLATLLNPAAAEPHLAWFVAGSETPSLARVADEWLGFNPFAWPRAGLPPSPLGWWLQWGLMLGTLASTAYAIGTWRKGGSGEDAKERIDPALVGLAWLSISLPFVAVRFLWLGVFPVLLVTKVAAHWMAEHPRASRPAAWAGALAAVLLALGFFRIGPWLMMRGTLPTTWAAYQQAYPTGKYHARLVWLVGDAGLEGTAFSDYNMAGFAGAYLAPEVRMLVNGTLNVPADVIAANLPLRERRGEREGERFLDLLDRHGVDIYFGIRLPQLRNTPRPFFHTTGHLERTPGWIPVFRNLAGAVYLRNDDDNRENVARVAEYYAEQGIPFDPDSGFDIEEVVRERSDWATRNGVIPVRFEEATLLAHGGRTRLAYGKTPEGRMWTRSFLAATYAALGLYERTVELDRERVEEDERAVRARRRLVWSLLRLGRYAQAAEAARALERQPAADRLSHLIADTARRVADETDEETRASLVAQLPVFDPVDVTMLTGRIMLPAPRPLPR